MATSTVGLNQLGSEMSLSSSLGDALEGFKKVLGAKAINASGLQNYLNGLSGSVPPPSPVMPTQSPVAPSVAPQTVNSVPDVHPELANTLITTLF